MGAGVCTGVYKNHLQDLEQFYSEVAPGLERAFGSAYPGFRDFYAEGGWGDGLGWQIAHEGGSTFAQTLALAAKADIDALQLVTWNDFGEGTMIEPTREFGFALLEQVQSFTGVAYDRDELALVQQLYALRKVHAGDAEVREQLDQVFHCLVALQVERARALLGDVE